MARLRRVWLNLIGGLWFVPALLVSLFAALAVVLVEIDEVLKLGSDTYVFKGDAPAARTVLSVLAGSLITVAALTLSLTIVVLQLAASQFSPRVLRTFFGDRLTQVTVGTFVGIFVYSIVVLRGVGSSTEGIGFVPRLSTTVASALGIAAVALLIVFIHHVSQLIQVSHVTAGIAMKTLDRLDVLYPERFGDPAGEEAGRDTLREWRAAPGGTVLPSRPGFVRQVDVDVLLAQSHDDSLERVAFLVAPGDFVSLEQSLAEIWPAAYAEPLEGAIRDAVTIESERDLHQDVAFGFRQLTDTAVKALSPGINDPTTAVMCVGYLRSLLVRFAGRAMPMAIRRFPDRGLELHLAHQEFAGYVDFLLEIGRYAAGDIRVVAALVEALRSVADAATASGGPERARVALQAAAVVAGQGAAEAKNDHDRTLAERLRGDGERAR